MIGDEGDTQMGPILSSRNAGDAVRGYYLGPLEFGAYLVGILVAFFLDAYLDVQVWRFLYHL